MTIIEALRSVTMEIKTWVLGKLGGYVESGEVGAANGVAPLDASSKLPAANLPEHEHDAGELPTASTSAYGVTKLTTSVTSTDATTAATPASVKEAYEKGVSAASVAATAQSTADTAKTNAATAQSTADTAKANAATAQTTADNAANAAQEAQEAADNAQTTADNAVDAASTAQSTADTAKTNAAAAQSTANTAINELEPFSNILGEVGQVLAIAEVDDEGKPTAYTAVTLKSGSTTSTFENVMLGNLMRL